MSDFLCIFKTIKTASNMVHKSSSGVFSLRPSEMPRSLNYLLAFVLLILYFLCVYSVASSNEG